MANNLDCAVNYKDVNHRGALEILSNNFSRDTRRRPEDLEEDRVDQVRRLRDFMNQTLKEKEETNNSLLSFVDDSTRKDRRWILH